MKFHMRKICLLLAVSVVAGVAPLAMAGVTHEIAAPQLDGQSVHVEVYLPPNYDRAKRYPVLYFNDGQDAKPIHLERRLAQHYAQRDAIPRIVVAVHMLPDRMGTYGLADTQRSISEVAVTRYGEVGQRALPYTRWFTQTLVPFIDAHYATQADAQGRAVLGWSLGAIAAFSIGWQDPGQFGSVGMFSPSLWLTADTSDATAKRLVQQRVEHDVRQSRPAIYLAIGTREDDDDRDSDGINDAVDDVFDMSRALTQSEVPHTTVLLGGGQHNQAAWSEMLPRYLNWLDTQTKSQSVIRGIPLN